MSLVPHTEGMNLENVPSGIFAHIACLGHWTGRLDVSIGPPNPETFSYTFVRISSHVNYPHPQEKCQDGSENNAVVWFTFGVPLYIWCLWSLIYIRLHSKYSGTQLSGGNAITMQNVLWSFPPFEVNRTGSCHVWPALPVWQPLAL